MTRYVHRLGQHHFAHLRAVAEGIPLPDSAERYLGIEHGHQARTAHLQTVDAVRAIARRRNENAWRLIGLSIRLPTSSQAPSLDDFIAERALDGWSEAEILEMYQEAYPANPRHQRRERLRERQLDLLRRLQDIAAEQPHSNDLVSGWFDEVTARKLIAAGFTTLQELSQRIGRGGRWFATLPGIGHTKAQRMEQHLRLLLGSDAFKRPTSDFFQLPSNHPSGPQNIDPEGDLRGRTSDLEGGKSGVGDAAGRSQGLGAPVEEGGLASALPSPTLPSSALRVSSPFAPSPSSPSSLRLLDARNDHEAIESWISARAGSSATVKVYRRESTRLLLWLQHERFHKTLVQMNVEDCRDFMAFLQHIPERWISRRHASPGTPDWAPFRGPLSLRSQRQSITIVIGLFNWLQSAQYLQANPWVLVNTDFGDDPNRQPMDSRSLSEAAMSEVLRFIEDQPPSPSRHRIAFLMRFLECTGLRSSEILRAKLEDFSLDHRGRWSLRVMGKGAKLRTVALPGQAIMAVDLYLAQRGLGNLQLANGAHPLVASTRDPVAPIGYQALYEHVRNWLSKAIHRSALPYAERMKLANASTHWLRHTYGTRAVARDVPLDVIQAQMGHATFEITASTYGKAPMDRRHSEVDRAFSGLS